MLEYSYDTAGRINGADVTLSGGSPQTLIQDIAYLPFGPISQFDYAGSYPDQDRNYDQDYRPTSLTGPLARTYTTDPVGNITAITEGSDTWHYGYDDLYRLLDVEQPLNTTQQSYTYDANGNRTSKDAVSYQIATNSNRLLQTGATSFSYDAMGNTTSMPNTSGDILTLSYGAHQRLVQSSNSSGPIGNYTYNGRGERVQKQYQATSTGPATTTVFLYDESGQLLGEYDASGNPIRQHQWLASYPIGVIEGTNIHAIHSDHLTTPRAVADSTGTTIWRWQSNDEPFGESMADTDPDADSNHFELGLRFPGQFYDPESEQHYNYFRDYDPGIGRYVESDPIGLRGGKNTYSYSLVSPINYYDTSGLRAWICQCKATPDMVGNDYTEDGKSKNCLYLCECSCESDSLLSKAFFPRKVKVVALSNTTSKESWDEGSLVCYGQRSKPNPDNPRVREPFFESFNVNDSMDDLVNKLDSILNCEDC
ncbi:MAG: hypothetical protein Tsb002_18490 [Wenzhouxiangellaceae bacterium]